MQSLELCCLDCRFLKHPWKSQGMHFCGIAMEWLKCRQYHQKWKNKTAWVGSPGRNKCSELFPGILKQELAAEHPPGWNCWAGAAPWSPGTAGNGHWHHLASLWWALNASSSQTEVVGKPRPGWLLFSVCFKCKLNWNLGGIHVPVVTSLHHCLAGSGLS